jgi:predicted nucleic acid-binding protein
MAVSTFLDSSVLIAGLIDFGTQSAPAQSILHAVAERQLTSVGTAWHCCLEFFSVSTRLPAEYRLTAVDAIQLMDSEIFSRMTVLELPAGDRMTMLKASAQEGMTGGRIYDAHIAHVARAAGATMIVTDNRRHFLASLRYGIRVETPAEFVSTLKASASKGAPKPDKP